MPDIESLNKNDLVEHPKGCFSFGRVPALPKHGVRGGDIYLRKGNEHFGVVHIWQDHEYDLRKLGYLVIDSVPDYVALLTEAGTPIFMETPFTKGGKRLSVLRSRTGILVLEERSDRDWFGYFVVTAFPRGNARGILIGHTE